MIENLIDASNMQKGLFLMLVGIVGVFSVLVVFFLMIKGFQKFFPPKEDQEPEGL